YRQDEFMDDPTLFERIIHPEDQEATLTHLREDFAHKDVFHLDFRIISRDGKERWISHYCQGVYGNDGSWLGRRASNRDITECKRAHEELQKVNRALKVLRECSHAMVHASEETTFLNEVVKIIVHSGGYRLAWVGFAEQDEEKRVRPVAQAGIEDGYLDTVEISWADNERGQGPTGTAIRTGKPSVCTNMLADPKYAPWRAEAVARGYASSIALPLLVGGQAIGALNIYATEEDAFDPEEVKLLMELANDLSYGITALRTSAERRNAEQALFKSSEKIKMFAYSVSHDLKNPAIAMHGLTKLLHKSYRHLLDEKGRHYCDQIMRASEHIVSLVEKINVYISTKEAPLTIEGVKVKEILQNVREEFSPELYIRQIKWLEPDFLPDINADRLSILRAFRNLVDNALKYGGDALREIEVGYQASEAFHILSLRDDGIGIRDQDSEKIFGPFKRKKAGGKRIEGAGLGLAIVKEIAEHHGGAAWLEAGSKKGATFYISIAKSL
ncbi:MAG: GAF domain-containing protein, partial [Proteobacteria bacterium]|nr:GAF domain-containing protein [Pseudomonadota bacterium]